MKKILILSVITAALVLSFCFCAAEAALKPGTVTILPPLKIKTNKGKKINLVPYALKKKVSLRGRLTIKTALMLLARQVSFPVVLHSGLSDKPKTYYFKNIALYKALNILKSSGFVYEFNKDELDVYGVLTRTIYLPVIDLSAVFTSTVGMNGMNSGNNQSSNPGRRGAGAAFSSTTSAAPIGADRSPAASPVGLGGQNTSNPGGSLSLSLSSSGNSLFMILKKNIKEMLGKSGKFFINPKDGIIWIKGNATRVIETDKYINTIKKDLAHQVFLKVEVLDVALNKNFKYGINWNMLFNDAFRSNAFGISAVSIGANLASLAGVNTNNPDITFSGSGDQAVIKALKSQGKVSVISQPRLTLIDGQTRLISSGTITPYVASVQTVNFGVTGSSQTYPQISQVQTGISIAFTPHINIKNNSVSVTISLIDNSITGYQTFSYSGNTFKNPIIQAKSLTDTVSVKSGKTIMIGGILTKNRQKQKYGVPVLSSIPIVGALFSGVNETYTKNDLIIMLTPEIIKN